MSPLNILHVFRTPVGGLFRHVLDLSRAQAARGHRVGIIADSSTGGARTESQFAEIAPHLALGVTRLPMKRHPNPSDLGALMQVTKIVSRLDADVVHGHGAKGGLYGRLATPKKRALRVYTPHGGSLHYSRNSIGGWLNLTAEQALMLRTDLFLFESAYSAGVFRRKIGDPGDRMRVVLNGVAPEEFVPAMFGPDATDLIYIGELRDIKGVDVLIDAVGLLHNRGRRVTATLVGHGPDGDKLKAQAERLGVGDAVRILPAMPVREALALGRIMVMCSRAESLPYVVLEAAASAKPLIATNVGGIPEIYGPLTKTLVPPGDALALSKAINRTFDNPTEIVANAKILSSRVASMFSLNAMVDGVMAGYEAGLARLGMHR
jgi:glycosyltransferase involved in cell wall biosynthesis